MANEATILVEGNAVQIPFTVADGTAIAKGALLKLADPNTASATSANADMLAGIAGSAKIASDGTTILGVFRNGAVVKMYASGSVTVGKAVCSAGSTSATHPNYVMEAPVTASGSSILGHALETASAGETFKVFLNVGGMGNTTG